MTEDTKTLREMYDGDKATFAEALSKYLTATCPSVGGNYTPRACNDNASRLWALYMEFKDSAPKEKNTVYSNLTSILRNMVVSCGNKKCGNVIDDLDNIVTFLKNQAKMEVKQDGK